MQLRKIITLLALFVLLIGGIWLLGRPGELAPESLARLQAFSPAQTGGDGQDGDAAVPEVIVHEPVMGSAIELSQLPVEPDNSPSMYELWLDGEIDLDEEEGFLTPEKEAELLAALGNQGPSDNIQVPMNSLDSIALEKSFPGPDIWKCCSTNSQAVVPPDPELAVGPNHLIAAINIAFEIYNKNGQVVQPNTTFSALFGGINGCNQLQYLFDPNVLYDESTDRFFLGIASATGYYCTAVSASGNPAGTWYRYAFPTNVSGGFFDYPHAGIGRDAIYMGGNIFSCGNCPYRDSRVFAFNKNAMYNNGAAGMVERAVPGGASSDTPQPANLHGFNQGTWPTSGPHYFITDTNFNGSTYTVYAWNAPFGANTFHSTGSFNWTAATGVSPVFPFVTARQLGSAARLRTNDWRPQDNEYRNGYLWTTSTISCNPGNGNVTCVRWAQINPNNGNIVQAGVLGSNDNYRYFGDVAANHCSDMAIGYTKSSANSYAGIWVAGRQSTDPPNTLQGETLMKAGERSYYAFDPSPHRWGDYTGFTSDPNGRDFWYLGQYSKNVSNQATNWGTFIGCYAVVSCSPPSSAPGPNGGDTPPAVPNGGELAFMPIVTTAEILPCGY